MKAMTYRTYGGPEVITLADVPETQADLDRVMDVLLVPPSDQRKPQAPALPEHHPADASQLHPHRLRQGSQASKTHLCLSPWEDVCRGSQARIFCGNFVM